MLRDNDGGGAEGRMLRRVVLLGTTVVVVVLQGDRIVEVGKRRFGRRTAALKLSSSLTNHGEIQRVLRGSED